MSTNPSWPPPVPTITLADLFKPAPPPPVIVKSRMEAMRDFHIKAEGVQYSRLYFDADLRTKSNLLGQQPHPQSTIEAEVQIISIRPATADAQGATQWRYIALDHGTWTWYSFFTTKRYCIDQEINIQAMVNMIRTIDDIEAMRAHQDKERERLAKVTGKPVEQPKQLIPVSMVVLVNVKRWTEESNDMQRLFAAMSRNDDF